MVLIGPQKRLLGVFALRWEELRAERLKVYEFPTTMSPPSLLEVPCRRQWILPYKNRGVSAEFPTEQPNQHLNS